MRCKNCGADNDDNRYICEVCGSPLYDEDDIEQIEANDSEKTQTFKAVSQNNASQGQSNNNYDYDEEEYDERANHSQNGKNDKGNKGAEKKSIIIIAVLAVILIAIIASVVAIAHNKNSDKKEETSSLTKISSMADDEDSSTNKYSTTKKETTTKETTESTTEKTTKAKTTASLWIINTSSSGGGEAEGDGKYENGKTVTLIARADDGYKFDGWYSNGVKVSDSEEYSFTANQNASFSAVFSPVETQAPSTTASAETHLPSDSELVFGE